MYVRLFPQVGVVKVHWTESNNRRADKVRNSLFCVSRVQKHARFFWKFVFSRAWNRRFYIRINFVVNLSLFNAKVRQVRERSVFSEVVYSRGPFGVGGWANGKIRLTISLFFFQDKA